MIRHFMMLDPKTPLQAGAIFTAGILVIAWTTLDINRVSRANERPLSQEQLEALQRLSQDAKHKAFGTADSVSSRAH